ncbi:MAG: SipW-dependent-type signal peptide-containing protein [Eubacteriales bacterium]|nr:SipW-dependent-type signal peptide-containing protein [Eubacteriales bacterium]
MTKKTRKTHKMRKVLLTVCCAALLVCVTIGATVAYLTSTDKVENTFTVGNVDITLDEAKVNEKGEPVDANGNVIDDNSDATAPRVDNNRYKLMPGRTYTKDPTVTVKGGSEECYVRVFVEFTNSDKLDEVFPNANLTSLFVGYNGSDWEYIDNVEDNAEHTRTYELRYKTTVTALTDNDSDGKPDDVVLPAVFTGIAIPGTIKNADLAKLNGTEINVTAQAIQKDGFDTAAEAWAKF